MTDEERKDLFHRLRFFSDPPYIFAWDDIKWPHRGVTITSEGSRPKFFRFTMSKYSEERKIYEWAPGAATSEVTDPDIIAVLKMAAFPIILELDE
jgi:hypothetical protein